MIMPRSKGFFSLFRKPLLHIALPQTLFLNARSLHPKGLKYSDNCRANVDCGCC